MKEFDISIIETLEKSVTVYAESRAEAEKKVRQAYDNAEYVFEAVNNSSATFEIQSEREIVPYSISQMDVLLIKPGMYPQQVQIACELEDLQNAVGGNIEVTCPFSESVALIVNEEGKIMGNELNRALRDGDGNIRDIIAGDFLVVGLGGDDFESLTPELMEQFEKHFHQPEMFVRMGRSIMALPLPEDKVRKANSPEKSEPKIQKAAHDRDSL